MNVLLKVLLLPYPLHKYITWNSHITNYGKTPGQKYTKLPIMAATLALFLCQSQWISYACYLFETHLWQDS